MGAAARPNPFASPTDSGPENMKHRIFLLGLDGASWNLLDRLLAAGVMPNLQRLCEEGVRATLASTVPPITPVAWSTLMTGVSPGKHGVFGFLTRTSADSYLQRPVNRLDLQVPTIFDYYRVADVVVSFPFNDGMPATLFEVMAMGKPLVVSNAPSVCEVVTHDHDALVCDKDDVHGLKEAFARLLLDEGLVQRLVANARVTLDRCGNALKHIDGLEESYARLVREGAAGRRLS